MQMMDSVSSYGSNTTALSDFPDFYTLPQRRSQRLLQLQTKCTRPPARIVVHKRTGKHRYIELSGLRKGSKKQKFLLVKENELPFGRDLKSSQFKVSAKNKVKI
jgi:hypothetical protein